MKHLKDEGSSQLIISDFQVQCFIGVYEFEKHKKQNVSISLEIEICNQDSFYTDDISDAVDYVELIQALCKLTESKHFNLVEHLAEKIAQLILQNWPVLSVKVEVGKVGVCSNAGFVGVKIFRSSINHSVGSSKIERVLLKKKTDIREIA